MPNIESIEINNVRKKIDPAVFAHTIASLLKIHKALPYQSFLRYIRLKNLRFIRECAFNVSELIVALPQLEHFEIVDCDFETDECAIVIANGIARSTKLKNITWTRITTKDQKTLLAIISALQQNPALQTLKFEYVRDPSPIFLKALYSLIQNSSSIKSLRLQLTTIQPDFVKDFANSIAANKSIEELVLNLKSLTEEGYKMILVALRGNNKLKKLHLVSGEMYTDNTIIELAASLSSNSSIQNIKMLLQGNFPSLDKLRPYLGEAKSLKAFNLKIYLHISMHGDEINIIPIFEGLKENKKLEKATLPLMSFAEAEVPKLRDFIRYTKELKKLKFNQIMVVPDYIEKAIGEGLAENLKIEHLIYKTKNIENSLKYLKLENAKNLKKLKIIGSSSENYPDSTFFANLIKGNTKLETLKLLRCNITNKATIAISREIEKHATIKRLNLNWLNSDMSGIIELIKAVKKNSNIRGIQINYSTLESQFATFHDVWIRDKTIFKSEKHALSFEGIMMIISKMCSNQRFKRSMNIKLDQIIHSYKHCVTGVSNIIVPTEEEMKIVKKVNLSNNSFGARLGYKIIKALSTCPQIEQVSLMGNKIKLKGCVAVSKMICCLPKLEILNLTGNRINVKGISWLCSSLRLCKSLKSLIIEKNPIHTSGASELIKTLMENKELPIENLDMKDCKIENSFVVSLQEFPTLGERLATLQLGTNLFSSNFVRQLIEIYCSKRWTMKITLSLRNAEGMLIKIHDKKLENLIKIAN